MNVVKDVDTLYRIPLSTDGPWFFAPVQVGTPPQTFSLMLDTGSSLSWIQSSACLESPTLCNDAPKFNPSSSSSVRYQSESIAVRYTEGVINTKVVTDIVTLGTTSFTTTTSELQDAAPDVTAVSSNSKALSSTNSHFNATSNSALQQPVPGASLPQSNKTLIGAGTGTQDELTSRFRGLRSFGLTNDVSGDRFLLTKEVHVSGFLGASRRRFESDGDFPTHFFAEIVHELPMPVFSLAFTDTWGTLTLGGPDPSFYTQPLSWVKTLSDEAGWVSRLSSRIELLARDFEPGPNSDVDLVHTNLNRVWFDSGTTYIWGDESAVRPINNWIGADPVTGQINCSLISSLGSIIFSIGGSDGEFELRLELSPSEYIIGTSSSKRCFSALNVSNSRKNHWIFGLQLLRGFYTVYHYGYGLIGIAPYNITTNNPVGKEILPGSHAILDRDVKDTLERMSIQSSSCSSVNSIPKRTRLSLLGIVSLLVFFHTL